ncbi:hypothetical protein LV716_02915 [Flagellimonas sp. HMM57]|uniref:hypothetical protein n=1 Tax=unclassified Flagellimonas TaxID=2644544 RepID=UPI0013D0735A|nr:MULTISPECIES: hypothetical protein [unclassified Flagellimonas]UII76758.1 hypothetical protein LV716_02915 [Flagellimonas sp. HMM57]
MRFFSIQLTLICILFFCCSSNNNNSESEETSSDSTNEDVALVTEVNVTGNENDYTFSVTISSPDKGCNQYADWWEVVDLDGNLIYRRILAHSHVNEQPFSRSGGAVAILENITVYVRAHMNNSGYGKNVMKGSVKEGFKEFELGIFAEDLDKIEPLPTGCAF